MKRSEINATIKDVYKRQNTDRAQIMAFVMSGACSSLAGALYAYKQKSAVPTIGDALTLSAIASIALGGTSMAGGRGSRCV